MTAPLLGAAAKIDALIGDATGTIDAAATVIDARAHLDGAAPRDARIRFDRAVLRDAHARRDATIPPAAPAVYRPPYGVFWDPEHRHKNNLLNPSQAIGVSYFGCNGVAFTG